MVTALVEPVENRRRLRRLGVRGRDLIFADFERWGFDERGWAHATRHGYRLEVQACDRFLHPSSILWATPDELKSFLFSKPPDPRTRNYVRQALVAFGAYLMDRHMAEVNSALGLPRLPEPESLPRALEREEARRIDVVSPSFGPMVDALMVLLLYGALRREEVRTLERTRILDSYVQIVGGKRAKDRTLPLRPEALARVKAWMVQNPDPRWVFPSFRLAGRPVSVAWIGATVHEVGNAAGVPNLRPHDLRHTVATTMLENGATVREVQEFLGHKSLASTQVYTKVRPVRLKEAAGRIDYGRETEAG